jgi:hypothetical protein
MSTHGKRDLLVYALAIGTVVLFCQRSTPTAPEPVQISDVTASLALPITDAGVVGFTKVTIQVTAKGMDTLRKEILPEAGILKTTLQVPSGNNRIFKVTAFINSTAVMAGADTLNLASGKTKNLNLKMQFLIPAITLTPTEKVVALNDTFSVYIKVHKVDSLSGVGARLTFDKSKLEAVDVGREDAFLNSKGGTIVQLQFNRNNTLGQVNLVLGLIGPQHAVSGEGTVGRVRFKALTANTNSELVVIADNTVDSNLGLLNNKGIYLNAFTIGSKVIFR